MSARMKLISVAKRFECGFGVSRWFYDLRCVHRRAKLTTADHLGVKELRWILQKWIRDLGSEFTWLHEAIFSICVQVRVNHFPHEAFQQFQRFSSCNCSLATGCVFLWTRILGNIHSHSRVYGVRISRINPTKLVIFRREKPTFIYTCIPTTNPCQTVFIWGNILSQI